MEATTPEQASPPTGNVGFMQALCGLAIALFIGYVLSRQLHWYDFKVVSNTPLPEQFKGTGSRIAEDGTAWSALRVPLWLCAVAVIPMNLIYIFMHRATDQLVPAVTNIVMGFVLSALTIYFIVDPDRALGTADATKNLAFTNEVAAGVYVSLGFALALLAVGVWQALIRQRGGESA